MAQNLGQGFFSVDKSLICMLVQFASLKTSSMLQHPYDSIWFNNLPLFKLNIVKIHQL